MTKKEMRKKMLSLRDSLSEKERREKSREIAKRLFLSLIHISEPTRP